MKDAIKRKRNKGKGRILWSYDDNSKINIVKSKGDKREDEGGKWGGGGCGYDRRDKFKGEHVNVAESQDVAMELK